ncbi:MAG TPA: hypothetical protein DCQ92_15045 [Verrucomicrobia subdivision 3 bacterium]|nr:hypothetical protein [Limisphaerales bacterium]
MVLDCLAFLMLVVSHCPSLHVPVYVIAMGMKNIPDWELAYSAFASVPVTVRGQKQFEDVSRAHMHTGLALK